jgi:uncharacterized protein
MEQRLSLVTLGVADLARSVAFYEALGWRRGLRAAEGVAFFQLGGVVLSLWDENSLADDAGVPARADKGFRGMALAHNVRSREEVDAAVVAVEAAGGTVTKAPEEKFWGGYGAYVADLDGHAWEIAWNPGFAIAADGSITLPD